MISLLCCSDEGEPTPEATPEQPVLVFLGGLLQEEQARSFVLAAAAQLEIAVDFTEDATAAGVIIGDKEPPFDHEAVPVRYWGFFADFWDPRVAIELASLPDSASVLLLPSEYSRGLPLLSGIPAAKLHWLGASQIPAALAAQPGSLALLPLEAADPRLRSLVVDGVDLLGGTWPAEGSRLVETVYVGWRQDSAGGLAREIAARLAAPPPAVTRLVFTGDVIPARCVYERQRSRNDYTSAFHGTADFLREADIAVSSLDGTISGAGEPFGCEETFSLLAPERSVEGLLFAGLDVITVASNHAKDCGRSGFCGDRPFLDTLANLRAAGIQPVGGGADLSQAHQPVVLTVNGLRLAFLGYDDISSSAFGATSSRPGTAALGVEALERDIAAARQQADVVIVLPHWGVEYTPNPTPRQQALAKVALEAGATLVIGNHPHVVQAVDWQADGFVAYALGNFVFDQDWSLETQQGIVLEAAFVGSRLASVRLHPIRIQEMHRPVWASPSEGASILRRVREASRLLP